MSKKGMKLSKNFWVMVIVICSVLLVLITIGFIAFSNRKPEIVEKEEEGGYVTLNYTSEVNALTLLKATPMKDEEGMKNMTEGQYFDFSVIKDEKGSTIDDDDIRIYLEKEEDGLYSKAFGPRRYVPSKNYSTVGSDLGSMVLVNDSTVKNRTENYRLRIWLSEDAKVKEGSYSVEVDIHAIVK